VNKLLTLTLTLTHTLTLTLTLTFTLSLSLTLTLALNLTLIRYELGHLAHASTADTLMLVGYAARTAQVPTTWPPTASILLLPRSDILMITAGILSACLDRQRQNRMMLFYFVVSCVFFILMLCFHYTDSSPNPKP
jgi:hypothetical protein|tara:strand:+ start:450 stop:857 length:408 start_codon:yes stop_codon:yes gene_type:complete